MGKNNLSPSRMIREQSFSLGRGGGEGGGTEATVTPTPLSAPRFRVVLENQTQCTLKPHAGFNCSGGNLGWSGPLRLREPRE